MKSIFVVILTALFSIQISAQDQIAAFISEAQGFLAQKEYKQAQMSLQDAINEINNMVAVQVAEALPDEINGLKSDGEENSSGGMGMMGGGMQIMKSYRNESKKENEAEVQIIANSPMLQAMSMYLANPAMMGQGYKSVRVGTQRAILKSEMQEYYDDNGSSKQIRSSEIQIPLNQTLFTINARGFATEADELAFAVKLGIEKIKPLLGE